MAGAAAPRAARRCATCSSAGDPAVLRTRHRARRLLRAGAGGGRDRADGSDAGRRRAVPALGRDDRPAEADPAHPRRLRLQRARAAPRCAADGRRPSTWRRCRSPTTSRSPALGCSAPGAPAGASCSRPTPSRPTAFALIERERVTVTRAGPDAGDPLDRGARARATRPVEPARCCRSAARDSLPEIARRIEPALGCRLQQVFGMAEGLLNYTRLGRPRRHVVIETQGRPLCAGRRGPRRRRRPATLSHDGEAGRAAHARAVHAARLLPRRRAQRARLHPGRLLPHRRHRASATPAATSSSRAGPRT